MEMVTTIIEPAHDTWLRWETWTGLGARAVQADVERGAEVVAGRGGELAVGFDFPT